MRIWGCGGDYQHERNGREKPIREGPSENSPKQNAPEESPQDQSLEQRESHLTFVVLGGGAAVDHVIFCDLVQYTVFDKNMEEPGCVELAAVKSQSRLLLNCPRKSFRKMGPCLDCGIWPKAAGSCSIRTTRKICKLLETAWVYAGAL